MSDTVKQDDRTPEQRKTHVWGVVASDKFMSGWGGTRGGTSRCAWACDSLEQAERTEQWVRGRDEMRYVRIVDLRTYRAPRGTAHFHIYVVTPEHRTALQGAGQAGGAL